MRKPQRGRREPAHWVETLPGARESLPSVVWVGAFVVSFICGGAAVALIGVVDQELLQDDTYLIGGFLLGAGGSFMALYALIRAWVHRRG